MKGQSVLALADSLDEYKRKGTLWAVAPSDEQTAKGDLETEVNVRLTSQETHIEIAGALEAGDGASLISSE